MKGGYGNTVILQHGGNITTLYAHMSRFASKAKIGSRIKQGQIIGYVGSTGLSTGPHLDYRFFLNGKPVDPLKVEVPPSHPVKEELKAEFEKIQEGR